MFKEFVYKIFHRNPWNDFDFLKRNVDSYRKNLKFKMFKVPGGKGTFAIFSILLICLLLLWLSTGLYTVNPEEEAVELIFGSYRRISLPGLHHNLPSPLGRVIKLPVTYINREEIGFSDDSFSGKKSAIMDEILMITADQNMANVQCEVQWRIKNIYDYIFHVKDMRHGETVKSAAESVIREVIGQQSLDYLIEGVGREYVAETARGALQQTVDSYQMGVTVLSVQMKKVDPPLKVIESFRDVQSAKADMERVINEAHAYSKELIQKTSGEVERVVKAAEAYKADLINRTTGNIDRLENLYREYQGNKAITKQRIYMDTLGEVMKNNKKIIIDPMNGNNLSLLPLNELFKSLG